MRASTAELLDERVKPFLKWAGGKSRLLPELLKRLPDGYEKMRYVEPFFGGGALFFALQPLYALLGDRNKLLMQTMFEVAHHLPKVLEELRELERQHSFETFQATRPLLTNPDLPQAARAAAFIYLNRTCFNGLYRVNAKGQFNVPFGRYTKPSICNADVLKAASMALRCADIRAVDFEELLAKVGKGDFAYFDPPYFPISETSNFTGYTEGGFGEDDQVRLAVAFRRAAERGAHVMMSQSNAPGVRRLYKGFIIQRVYNSRSISANGDGRLQVPELIIRNYR